MLDGDQGGSQTDIAIIGMALRVPGASNVQEFWTNLRAGVESIRNFTPDELIAAGETRERLRRKNYVPRAAELPDMEFFDAAFFGLSPKEAAIMDPQHRHFLECSWEAMEDAARPPESISGPVGVFAGCGMGSYFYFNVCSHRSLMNQVGMFLLRHTGNDKDFLATRASYAFDLRGPSINVQTACSTSLVAVHLACQSLLAGECDMALAGGVTIELPHRHGYLYQDGEILSPDGHCRAFDHRATGTVFGSGAGVVVLRKLADALADGDPIRAVIKATAINNDGASKAGYLAPSVDGQANAIVEALTLADVSADSVQYVECHGTGTYLGDPIEIAALTQAFRQTTDQVGYCRVGSVKTNIGHLDTAAGVVSLIKTALALQHAEIPPSLNFETPNPAIDFTASPFIVNDRLTPWPAARGPRRASVNSLGVGGTNAHAVLEEAPPQDARPTASDVPQLLAFSAKSRKALDDSGLRLAEYLRAEPAPSLPDVALTLQSGRRHFEHRRVVAVANCQDAVEVLADPSSTRSFTHTPVEGVSGAVFLFPGGGAQYPGMAQALYRKDTSFAADVDAGLAHLPSQVAREVFELWLGAPDARAATTFLRPSLQLPAILILEVALARLWMRRGIKPVALLGHSMGENAAACVAGVMSFESAVNLVYLRGRLFEEISGGGMLSIPLSVTEVQQRLLEGLDLASVNAPDLCVVSGPNQLIDQLREKLIAEGIEAGRIPIDVAAHSRLLEPILARFGEFVGGLALARPRIPIVSNLTGTWLSEHDAQDPHYWVKHLRSTVRFADGLATLAADKARIYIEVGPGRALSSLAKAQRSIEANQIINSLPHAEQTVDDHLHFLTAVGRAWSTGLPAQIAPTTSPAASRRITLPTYPFQHQRYFLDRVLAPAAQSDVPTKLPDIADWGWRPVWKASIADTKIGAERIPSSFLIFLDDAGFGAALADRLRSLGHTVKTVAMGDAFAIRGESYYVLCPEHGREGYDALVTSLTENGGLPERIVHLWLLTGDEGFRPGSSFFHRNQEHGFYSLLFLAQALGSVETAPMQITVLTNGMQRVDGEDLPYPEKAMVLGPAKVLPREMVDTFVRVIDLPVVAQAKQPDRDLLALLQKGLNRPSKQSRSSAHVDLIWGELFAANGNETVAYRGGRRWSLGTEKVPLEQRPSIADRFRPQGVYLLTGGLGDIAAKLGEELARRYAARLVLVGRTELPERAQWPAYVAAYGKADRIGKAIAAIKGIEDAGGEVLYVRADVTNPEAMRGVVAQARERFGAIHGVLHTAGVVRDELIQLKMSTDVEDVFAPKVLGTLVLDEVLAEEPLDFLMLFSSTSSDIAPAGQVDYVAANAYLNAFAESSARRTRCPAIAIHWGIWNSVGLAARAVKGAGESLASVEIATEPLFDRRIRDDAQGDWLEHRCTTSQQWLLDEHRLRTGEAVWPGTGYLELIAEAARKYGIGSPLEVADLAFLRALHVPDREARSIRVSLQREHGHCRFFVDSHIDGDAGAAWLRHAEAKVSVLRAQVPPALDIPAVLASCQRRSMVAGPAPLRSAQAGHLRFGPRWQVLHAVHLGEDQALAKLELDPQFAPDLERGFLMHPALMDIATGFAMDLIENYDPATGLWVPISYEKVRFYRPLPAKVWSWAKLDKRNTLGPDFATFNVTIADEQGEVLVQVEGFTIRQLMSTTDFGAMVRDVTGASADTARKAGSPQELSPALARLAAQVEQGIEPEEGFEAMLRAIGTGLPQVIVSSLDLEALQQTVSDAEAAPASAASFERPNVESQYLAPRNPIEQTLAQFWSELLGIEKIGVNDNFFELGGHSLIAVRLFRMMKKAFAVDFPISVLFESPTIGQCAELIERSSPQLSNAESEPKPVVAATGQPRRTSLVQMHVGRHAGRTPLFVCAGMFGNILNLRHLAVQIGQDRPVWGLQARGLYGDQAPHETFEEMATAYVEEIRTVLPHGPYLLSGFSGGGLVAYEMAQQLHAAGEEVAAVVMLDTPYPEQPQLSVIDRVSMKLQDLQREGTAFLGNWARNRLLWELSRRGKGRTAEGSPPEQFHNDAIEAAFRRAVSRYNAKPYAGHVVLLRPRLQVAYRLPGGRNLNFERSILRADNGWSPYIANLSVLEVPGNHDSMVLEPNVRVLTSIVRATLDKAEHTLPALLAAE